MKTLRIALATILTGCLAGAAQATVAEQNLERQVVSYADLNLESSADAATLLRRIQIAARKVCGVRYAGPLPLAFQKDFRNCAADSTARAVADVNAPMLTFHATGADAPERIDVVRADVQPTVVALNQRVQVYMLTSGHGRGRK